MFPEIVLGHLVGDYLFQNNWMALKKDKHNGLGTFTCTVHCCIYTLCVCILMGVFSWQWVVYVFFSHFFIDKFSLAEKWLRLIRGRSLGVFMETLENHVYTPHIGLRAGFGTVVYAVVDNTMHLVLMWYGWKYFFQ